jgi:dTDP-4-dehydrorhamnose reductase
LTHDGDRADKARVSGRPVLVFGAAGQLGEAMTRASRDEWRTIPFTRAEVDLANTADVRRLVADARPWAIINCAGYNKVDAAEDDAMAALTANAFAVRALGAAARDVDAVLVHYSSDFIFDGETDAPYTEESRPRPQSVYAASKLIGEWFAADAPAHYVLRVESLFGGVTRQKSSLDAIIDGLVAAAPVRVFRDRTVSPSYVWDVAAATIAMLQRRPASGVYHCVNSGHATWYEIAEEVARQLHVEARLEPITLADVQLRARRPRYCALANDKLRAAGIVMPTWQDAIGRVLAARGARAEQN